MNNCSLLSYCDSCMNNPECTWDKNYNCNANNNDNIDINIGNYCSITNNPLPPRLVLLMILFIFGITTIMNAISYSFFMYRYEKCNPLKRFFIGLIIPYFCWFLPK